MIAPEATKEKSPVAGEQGGDFGSNPGRANHIAEKQLATIRAKLCICGGQTLHIATDRSFFVVTPFGQITKFDTLAELQAHADRGAR